jgi:predicted nucleotidyltransferase
MKETEIIEKIRPIIQSHPEIKLAYLFGSRIRENTSATSDIDLAF